MCFLLVLSIGAETFAQAGDPRSFALIIGISDYKDPNITPLNFAHRDAEAFASLCISPDGLNIPPEQIRLLTNEDASYWHIVDGLDWLKSVAKRNDMVYFYFAGHGDMESKELQYGYLLPHDSRYMNYLGRSLSLDLLNKTAHTLSVVNHAQVFLITDACHSGKLAGVDFNGNNLVALNLMQRVSNNEVRIASCNEGELSYEDESWGNGRGAFSYFLTKGMAGEADGLRGRKDGIVTVGEMKAYLSKKVPDEVRNLKRARQNPVVMGTYESKLSRFNPTSGNIAETISGPIAEFPTSAGGSRGVSHNIAVSELANDIGNQIDKAIHDGETDFLSLSLNDSITIINHLLAELTEGNKYSKETLYSAEACQLIAKSFFDKVQHVIDLYLGGDEAELERRRYYSQIDAPYEEYPHMLEIAIKLLEPGHSLISTLTMQKEYLTGLSHRLRIPFSQTAEDLIQAAFSHQLKAYELEPDAAYIHNELGILYHARQEYEKAKFHYERAIAIAPLWSLPYSNLANLYFSEQDYPTSKYFAEQALTRQSNLQSPYIIQGNNYMQENNLLFAEEQYQHAIKLNSRHYLPFEKLGGLYLKTQDFGFSNDYFYEAELRKMGLNFEHLEPLALSQVLALSPSLPCPIDTLDVNPGDIVTHLAIGKYFFDMQDFYLAQRWFDKVVNLDVGNPLVYHYLGQTAYYFKEYSKAEFYFGLAIDKFVDDSSFEEHLNQVSKGFSPDHCAVSIYRDAYFEYYDPNIYLARTYEKWGNYKSAAEQYNRCIDMKPENALGYAMLWNLFKNREELISAENTIRRFGAYFPGDIDDELSGFYHWVLNRYSNDLQKTELYAYKHGLLMHEYMMKHPDNHFGESLKPDPDQPEEDFDFNRPAFWDRMISSFGEGKLINEVTWVKAPAIQTPLSTGVAMFRKVVSISVDRHITADAYTKMGDIYFRAESPGRALENYESALGIKDDDIGIRSRAIACADQLYLFRRSLSHLMILHEVEGISFNDGRLLAKYFMKSGDIENALLLATRISNTHPYLKELLELDIIKVYLRFGRFSEAIELLHQYKINHDSDTAIDYMLARAYASAGNENEALLQMGNAVSQGFNLGFVYKNDTAFDKFRSNPAWSEITQKMDAYIRVKMAENQSN